MLPVLSERRLDLAFFIVCQLLYGSTTDATSSP
jgi:hypothetical protein